MKYTIGLDLGISSIGWAVIGLDEENNPTHIVDANVTIIDSMEDDKGALLSGKRREQRGIRRSVRRRQYRVSKVKYLIQKNLGINVNHELYNSIKLDPYSIKVKGLEEELKKEELAIALVHYAKHRGFKSNRKHEKSSDAEDGKALETIGKIESVLREDNLLPSQYLQRIRNENVHNKVRNSNSYDFVFKRDTIQKEIEQLLQTQLTFKVIDQQFIDSYIKIWSSQRDFSEGPSAPSKYTVDFAKQFGNCTFERSEMRAPRSAPSVELFTLIQKLQNLPMTHNQESYSFSNEEIKELVELAKSKVSLKYADILKTVDKELIFTSLNPSKDEFIKIIFEYKEKMDLPREENIDFKDSDFIKFKNAKVVSKDLYSMKNYHKLKSEFKKLGFIDVFNNYSFEQLDDIVRGHTFYRTEEKLRNFFYKEGDQYKTNFEFLPEHIEDILLALPSFSESASLSLKAIYKINEKMLEGYPYDKACKECGYDHSKAQINVQRGKYLPNIGVIEEAFPNELTNPRVKRVLCQTIKLINLIVERYGRPYDINLEVARDIANIRSKRNKMEWEMLENFERNQQYKDEISKNFTQFKSPLDVKKDDIIKYRLYKEQDGMCAYSHEQISPLDLFTDLYQIDHIIPYSRSFDDSYKNKTLVKASQNQKKTNKTPFEYFSKDEWSKFVKVIDGNYKISQAKKNMYFAKEITGEMKERSLNDTRYIVKYVTKVFENFLKVDGKINSYKAGVVSILKKQWRIDRFTHSFDSKDYRSQNNKYLKSFDVKKDKFSMTFNTINYYNDKAIEVSDDLVIDIKLEKVSELNNKIERVYTKYLDETKEFLENNKEKAINQIIKTLAAESKYSDDMKMTLQTLLLNVEIDLQKNSIKKNRDNHLHHVLDAIAVAVVNNSLMQRVTAYSQNIDYYRGTVSEEKYIDHETSEEISKDEYIIKYKISDDKKQFPLPYEKFVDEVKYRVYELDGKKQQELFDEHFNDGYFRNIRPITPYRNKINRSRKMLHKETIYSKVGDNAVIRTNVKDLTLDKLDKVVDKDASAKHVYDAIRTWIQNGKKEEYPTLSNGREIKRVKLINGDAKKLIEIRKDAYAQIDSIVCIDIYKLKTDNKYYFVQRSAFDLAQEKRGDNPKLIVWWGRAKNHEISNLSDINSKYDYHMRLYPNEMIELKLKEAKSNCYMSGFGSGMLEVKSVIGDSMDLINSGIVGKFRKRNQITVSTITNITKININPLGEISEFN